MYSITWLRWTYVTIAMVKVAGDFAEEPPLMIPLFRGGDEHCISYDLPPGEDGHMGFTAISQEEPDATRYFAIQALEDSLSVSPKGDGQIPDQADVRVPRGTPADVTVTIYNPVDQRLERKVLNYNSPIYFKNLNSMAMNQRMLKMDPDDIFGLYSMCFEAEDNVADDYRSVIIIIHVVHISAQQEIADYKENEKMQAKFEHQKKADEYRDNHLNPLEKKLDTVIMLADSVINDWDFLETREGRMRATSETTQSRVQTFSYMSITVLIVTTIVQSMYLKNYFKKRKLM